MLVLDIYEHASLLVLTKEPGSSACNLDVHVALMWECLGMRYRKDMHACLGK